MFSFLLCTSSDNHPYLWLTTVNGKLKSCIQRTVTEAAEQLIISWQVESAPRALSVSVNVTGGCFSQMKSVHVPVDPVASSREQRKEEFHISHVTSRSLWLCRGRDHAYMNNLLSWHVLSLQITKFGIALHWNQHRVWWYFLLHAHRKMDV